MSIATHLQDPLLSHALLAVAALTAGVLNAVAGGGSFLTFPALVATGVPPIAANATSAMAVAPGYLGSTLGFREELQSLPRQQLLQEMAVVAVGGLLGALLLLVTPAQVFSSLVPWLLGFATVLFALGPRLTAWLQRGTKPATALAPHAALSALAAQSSRAASAPTPLLGAPRWVRALALLLVAVYGGYFNGGLGILLMAAYLLLGESSLHHINGQKNLSSLVLSILSVLAFAVAGAIWWPQALWMMLWATLGGWLGARWAKRLPVGVVRLIVIATGVVMTLWFAFK